MLKYSSTSLINSWLSINMVKTMKIFRDSINDETIETKFLIEN